MILFGRNYDAECQLLSAVGSASEIYQTRVFKINLAHIRIHKKINSILVRESSSNESHNSIKIKPDFEIRILMKVCQIFTFAEKHLQMQAELTHSNPDFQNILRVQKKVAQHFNDPHRPLFETNNRFSMTPAKPQIIVDTRELNSSIPYLLFGLGFTIEIRQLKSGDYILPNNIAVERKDCKTGDFYQSMESRHLQQQVDKMSQEFNRYFLVIQNFDFERVFFLERIQRMIRKHQGLSVLWAARDFDFVDLLVRLANLG